MSAATSWIGIAMQVVMLKGYTPDHYLLMWVGVMLVLEVCEGMLAAHVKRLSPDPDRAEPVLRALIITLFVFGSCWGFSCWLPGLRQNNVQFVGNLCVVVVIGVFSVHNLNLNWRALAAFCIGLIWPTLLMCLGEMDNISISASLGSFAAFGMTQFYGVGSRNVEMQQIRQMFQVEELADHLRHKNEELERAFSRIITLAEQDPLTACLNRRALTERFAAQGGRRAEDSAGAAIIMIDADHFKKINDGFGHEAGDQVLIALSACVQSMLRSSDLLGRWGGEEFVCVITNVDESAALELAERVRAAVAELSVEAEPEPLRVTVSVGAALMFAGEAFDDAVRRADQALYQAKAAGRNRVCFSQPTAKAA
ncbi:MAG TPA: GGDEF domain-containing protein [Burkholderiaceae bacterium]